MKSPPCDFGNVQSQGQFWYQLLLCLGQLYGSPRAPGQREGVSVQIREQLNSNLELQSDCKSELMVGNHHQITEHEGKTWERQRNDIDTQA